MANRERNDDLARHFGENLRRVRRLARLSQDDVACRAALHRTEVSLIERGYRVPSTETLIKLAAAVEAPEGRLLDGIDWIPSVDCGKGAFIFHAPLNPSMLRWIGDGDGVRRDTNHGGRG